MSGRNGGKAEKTRKNFKRSILGIVNVVLFKWVLGLLRDDRVRDFASELKLCHRIVAGRRMRGDERRLVDRMLVCGTHF